MPRKPSSSASPPPSRLRVWLKRLFILSALGFMLGLVGVAAVVVYFSRDLPKFDSLRDYAPPRMTRIYANDGTVVGEVFTERRTVVPMSDVPAVMVQAIVAAEDANFFEHGGVDWLGIIKAAVSNLRSGGHARGASTLTQQTVKTFLLTNERSYSRKIKEAILALRLERNLSKQDILHLYLNQIYFGNRRYGIEEAARYYFNKSVKDITLEEASALASIPKSPSQLNPRRNAKRAKERQIYVLQRMQANGFISAERAAEAIAAPLPVAPLPAEPPGAWYVAEVRRQLIDSLGETLVLEGGLRVETAMDATLQKAAEQAVQTGLRALDKRQGYRGALATLDDATWSKLKQAALAEHEADEKEGVQGWSADEVCDLRRIDTKALAQAAPADDGEELAERSVRWKPREAGEEIVARVSRVTKTSASVDLCSSEETLTLANARWARGWNLSRQTAAPTNLSQVLKPGDLILVRIEKKRACAAKDEKSGKCTHSPLDLSLEQMPLAEGALVAIEPDTRGVVALVGGYDFSRSFFNRATQARRQSGSAFKPLIYAAALEQGQLRALLPPDVFGPQARERCTIFTNRQTVFDTPELIRDKWTGQPWQPKNYAGDVFDGPMSLRDALAASKNTIAVKLMSEIGCEPTLPLDFDAMQERGLERVKDLARRVGINSAIPNSLTVALGAGEVTPIELTNAYATFAMDGRFSDPILIRRVLAPDGAVLVDNTPKFDVQPPLFPGQPALPGPPRGIRAALAYVVTDLMRSVVESPRGTGASMRKLNRPIAAKTGTANEQRDAWFIGYTPEVVTGVWTGFDNHDPLGSAETGGRAAGPIWLDFMQKAEATLPHRTWEVPAGVVVARIDPTTGLLASDSAPQSVEESYLAGTEPTEEAPEPDAVDIDDFFRGGGP